VPQVVLAGGAEFEAVVAELEVSRLSVYQQLVVAIALDSAPGEVGFVAEQESVVVVACDH
tara:strand:+ start:5985 stop:6164 length:180 start_codon:yes stop_codon:yes gene_type:complete